MNLKIKFSYLSHYSTQAIVEVVLGQVCGFMPGVLLVPLFYLQWTMSFMRVAVSSKTEYSPGALVMFIAVLVIEIPVGSRDSSFPPDFDTMLKRIALPKFFIGFI